MPMCMCICVCMRFHMYVSLACSNNFWPVLALAHGDMPMCMSICVDVFASVCLSCMYKKIVYDHCSLYACMYLCRYHVCACICVRAKTYMNVFLSMQK